MPIFEFECSACRDSFDELVRHPEALKDVVCPACGSKKVKKKLSTFASNIKGGGAVSSVSSAACAPGGG
jgi:putative FmdB family regulatory protein